MVGKGKRLFVGLIFGLVIGMTQPVGALCDLSKPVHTTECISDPYGVCCVVESYFHDQTCYDLFCMSFDSCTWELSAPPLCT